MKSHRLKLNRETIRALTGIDLTRVAGGLGNPSVTDEMGKCCTQTVTCRCTELCSIVTDC